MVHEDLAPLPLDEGDEAGEEEQRGRDVEKVVLDPVLDLLADVAEHGAHHVKLERGQLLDALVASVLQKEEGEDRMKSKGLQWKAGTSDGEEAGD